MVNWMTICDLDFADAMAPLVQDVGTCAYSTSDSFAGKGSVVMTTAASGGASRARVSLNLPMFMGYIRVHAVWKSPASGQTYFVIRDKHQYSMSSAYLKVNAFGWDATNKMYCYQSAVGSPETYSDLTTPNPGGVSDPLYSNAKVGGIWDFMTVVFRRGAMVEATVPCPWSGTVGGRVAPPFHRWDLSSVTAVDGTAASAQSEVIEVEALSAVAATSFYLGKLKVEYGDA